MYPTSQVSYGQSGAEVKKLQNFLIGQGMSIQSGATGYFGNETKAALQQWQSSNGIPSSTPGFGTDWGSRSIAVAQTVNSNKMPVNTGIPGLQGGQPLNSGSTNPTAGSASSVNTSSNGSAAPAATTSPLGDTSIGKVNGMDVYREGGTGQYYAYKGGQRWSNGDLTSFSGFLGGTLVPNTPAASGRTAVTLGNGTTAYVDTSGQAWSASSGGTKVSNTAIESSTSGNMSETDMEKTIDDMLQAAIASGYAINPGLTDEDIAAIDPKNFMDSAAATIAPEYAQKFAVASDTLKRALDNANQDYTSSVEKTNRSADESLLSGTETLASRGLAFSGAREKFIGDVGYERSLGIGEAAQTAQRSGQTAFGTAEGLIGTSALQGLGVGNSIAGRNLSFSSTPIVGSYNSEKAYTTEAIAKELASKEAQRRGYATRSLSFA